MSKTVKSKTTIYIYIFLTFLLQRQGIDISEADHQSGNISDSGMIKVEKSESSDGENPFDDDEDDEDEWQSNNKSF